MPRPKIAMIGAGSLIFCKTLTMDILATKALQDSEICLMNRTKPKLDKMEAFVKGMVKENKLPAKVTATLDLRKALDGAKYVINMIQVGGVEAFRMDYEIPLRHGVDQCIADSIGPGGVFRALRTIPALAQMCTDMNELCPEAILLNYANPMGANCSALGRLAKVQFIGLCHGVQTTLDLISRYVEVPKDQIDFVCAGINHMAWFLALRDKRDGRDLYPILRKNIEKPEYYINEKVRGEVMRHFGYFMTESTGHLSEYVPWFRSSQRALDLYCDQPAFGGASGAYFNYCNMLAEKYKSVDYLATESQKIQRRSVEYCSYILEAAETGQHLPAQRQRPQRRLHHEPAAGVLRGGAGLRGCARAASHAHRGPAAAVRRPESKQRHRAAACRRGGADRQSRVRDAGHRPGPADLGGLHAERGPGHDARDAGGRETVAAGIRGQETAGQASGRDLRRCAGRGCPARPGLGHCQSIPGVGEVGAA